MSTTRVGLIFGISAVATLAAGVIIERSGEEFFARQGLSGILFGRPCWPLPELSASRRWEAQVSWWSTVSRSATSCLPPARRGPRGMPG
jgi:hypothetical protein